MAQRHAHPVALLFLDLDHFKTVNDSLGHRVGDAVLMGLARRLRAVVRAQDTVARQGGDEFVLLLPETEADGAAHVAQKILAAAQEPFEAYGHELTVTPSVGVALYPNLVTASNADATITSLTVHNAASSQKTLGIMLVIALLGMPMVLAYTAIVYWTFRGKAKADVY